MTKDDILAALPKLTRPDLEAVQAVCTSLLGGRTGHVAAGATTLAAGIFEALTGALNVSMSYSNLPTATERQFRQKLPTFTSFLDKSFEGWNKNKVSQLAFLKMLFELLIADLRKRGAQPTIGIMVVNLNRMPEVFNDAFPGYIDAGLAKLVLKNFQA